MSKLTEQLNEYRFSFTCTKKGPKLSADPPEGCCNEEGLVTDPHLDTLLDNLDGAEVYFGYHPYGRCAGKVCYVELGGELSWYDKHGECRWRGLK